MSTKIWGDGVRSVEAFVEMAQAHPTSSSGKQAARLLLSAILGQGSCNLNRMSVFDTYNRQHAMNIINAVGEHGGNFCSQVNQAHSASLRQISKNINK
jgi:hypothetical protein